MSERPENRGLRARLANAWQDIQESTDARLLALPRFLGLLYGPIDRTLPFGEAFRKSLSHRLPAHVGWRHAFGGITYLLFMILIVTGVLLSFYYRPSVSEAYPSMQQIVSEVPFGWLVRDLHVWSASLIVVVALVHMGRVYFSGAYRRPRETNWLIGLFLLLLILAFGATGYLLPWDQWSYWTVSEALSGVRVLPGGGFVAAILMGDVIVSGATLSRFYSLHVIILPWIALGLLTLHFSLLRTHGIAPTGKSDPRAAGPRFYPGHVLRMFIVTALTLAIVMSLAALYPRPFSAPANPYVVPENLLSNWVVVDVSLALLRYLGVWGFVLFSVLGVVMAVIPLIDRRPYEDTRRKWPLTLIGVVFFAVFFVAWLAGSRLHSVSPSAQMAPEALEERILPAGPGFQEDATDAASEAPENGQPAEGDQP